MKTRLLPSWFSGFAVLAVCVIRETAVFGEHPEERQEKLKQAHRKIREAVEEGDLTEKEARERVIAMEREMHEMHMNFKRAEALDWILHAEESGMISGEEAEMKRDELAKEFREIYHRRDHHGHGLEDRDRSDRGPYGYRKPLGGGNGDGKRGEKVEERPGRDR